MKSINLKDAFQVELVEKEIPRPKEGEALIKVKSVGICGSDIGAFRGTNPLVTYPRTIGHEIAGEVVTIGENKKGIKQGNKVILDPYLYCSKCYPCSLGRTNCCEDLQVLGVHCEGGMAEYICHPADMLVKVPEDMEWDVVPLAEPLTIALHGLHRARLTKGEHIVIIGAGTIGLLAAMTAIYYGAIPIMIDVVDERLRKAKELGIHLTINSAKENAQKKVIDYTDGRKAEVVMEASGANPAVLMTLDLVANAGRIILTGWPKAATLFPTDLITKKEVDIMGARTSAGEFDEAIDIIYKNKVNARGILTKTVTIDEAVEVIKDIEKNPGNYLKVNVIV
ncbi:MAG TPA: alcohol dehydrogenase catalytic domain-containing protein [Clostridiales bacterium]|nr:alcohol dehydrogenase catalytic domain-containing protein [Clostridiales bacterium]